MKTLKNIFRFALNPRRGFELVKKLFRRKLESRMAWRQPENLAWIRDKTTSFPRLAQSIDPLLWRRAQVVANDLKDQGREVLAGTQVHLGGGAYIELIYFLCRIAKPEIIVETGVAAGFSSKALLIAIQHNGRGRLFSSDFPYFRLENPEQYIGMLVDDHLRRNWTLLLDGDDTNLPQILRQVDRIDYFHYDSDKSYEGRKAATDRILNKLHPGSILIYDDIQDNPFFFDLIHQSTLAAYPWHIFGYENKHIGVIGNIRKVR